MNRLDRFPLLKVALYGTLALSSAARAEPSPIGGLPRQTPTVASAPSAVLSTVPSRSVQVTFSGPRALSVQEQIWAGPLAGPRPEVCGGCRVEPVATPCTYCRVEPVAAPCTSCRIEPVVAPCGGCQIPDSPEPDSVSAVNLAGFSVLVRDPSSVAAASLGAPSLARFRGKLPAGSSVRYVFEGLHTVGVLQPLDGEAVLSLEDCAGNPIATASPTGASSVLDAYSGSGTSNCRALLVQSRNGATFELTTYNFR